jgi:Cyanobacterial and plant NDH-1 subunit O
MFRATITRFPPQLWYYESAAAAANPYISMSTKINMAVKKGDAVCAVAENLANSLEAQASDSKFSDYIFKTKGEVLDIRGDYALVKFTAVSTPNVWLRLDQLQAFA